MDATNRRVRIGIYGTGNFANRTHLPNLDRIAGAELVKRIQSGLTAASVADLTPDGIVGERTRSAIRTFEALEGLEVTGAPDPRILERLIEIGAIQ